MVGALSIFYYIFKEGNNVIEKSPIFCRTLGTHQNKNIVMLLFGTHLHFIYNESWNVAKQYGIKFEVFFQNDLGEHFGNRLGTWWTRWEQ